MEDNSVADMISSSEPYLTIIIPAYNVERYLECAVHSVFTTQRNDLEIIIVEDRSHDSTLEIAKGIAEHHPGVVKVLQNTRKRGAAAARNLGISASRGQILAFLDGDDLYMPGRFSGSVEILKRDAGVGAVYGLTRVQYDRQGKRDFEGLGRVVGDKVAQTNSCFEALCKGYCWHINAFTVRRSVISDVGKMNEHLARGQDLEFFLRVAHVAKIVAEPERKPIAVYRRYGSNRAKTDELEVGIEVLNHTKRWLKKREADQAIAQVERGAALIAYEGAAHFLRNRRPLKGFKLLAKYGRMFPSSVLSRRFWGNVQQIALQGLLQKGAHQGEH